MKKILFAAILFAVSFSTSAQNKIFGDAKLNINGYKYYYLNGLDSILVIKNDSVLFRKPTNIAGGGGSGVTNVETGFGLSGGPITTTGTIQLDTAAAATRARVQKGIDSINAAVVAGLAAKANASHTHSQSDITGLTSALAAKQDNITLTTTGTSGVATFSGNTLNIPNYGGVSGFYSARSTITPATNFDVAKVKHTVNGGTYEDANNILKIGDGADDTKRTVTINVVLYVSSSNMSVGTWTNVGTIPAAYRPTGITTFPIPEYYIGTANPSTTQIRSSGGTGIINGQTIDKAAAYVDGETGFIWVKIGTYTSLPTLSGDNTVIIPLLATWFINPNLN